MKVLLLILAAVAFPIFAKAQPPEPLTEFTGTAIDQNGAAIPLVKVVLTNEKGIKFEDLTQDDGTFRLKVPAGTYLIEANYIQHKAWEPFRVEKYEVAVAKRMTIDICLRVDKKFTEIHGTPVTSEKKRKP